MNISCIKLSKPIGVLEGASVREISKILEKKNLRHVYVIDKENVPLGVVGISDINSKVVVKGKSSDDLKAKDIMNKKISTVDVNDKVSKAYLEIINLNTSSLPVVKDGKLIGVVSIIDCVKCLLEEKNEQTNA